MIDDRLDFVANWISIQGLTTILLLKLTVLLVLAWTLHGVLGRSNPRWRVILWRVSFVGLALVVFLSVLPAQLEWRVTTSTIPVVPLEKATPTTPNLVSRDSNTRVEIGRSVPSIERPTPAGSSWIRNLPFGQLIFLVWFVGVLHHAIRLIVSAFAIRRIVSDSAEAPEWIQEAADRVARSLDYRGTFRVRHSPELTTPCLAGFRSPTLLITQGEIESSDVESLRAVLAHELSHARNHDLVWNLVAHLATISLWFHPLAWHIRAVHISACEAVSDAMAVANLGDTESYVRTLAQIALGAHEPVPASGVAMARSSDVTTRIRALRRFVHTSKLSRQSVLGAVLGGSITVVALGTFGVLKARESDANVKPRANNDSAAVIFRLVDQTTKQPAAGIPVQFSYRINGPYVTRNETTDDSGIARLNLPPGTKFQGLNIKADKPGFVPIVVNMNTGRKEIVLPFKREFAFEKGTTISGTVKDPDGKPVAAAPVTLYMPPTEADAAHYSTDFAHVKTDANGVWTTDQVPAASNRSVTYSVDHPDFLPGGGQVVQLPNTPGGLKLPSGLTLVLRRGLTVQGRVLSNKGTPIANAKVIIGLGNRDSSNPTAKTDASGHFVLKRCRPGPSAVVVESDDLAPEMKLFELTAKTEPLEFRLSVGTPRRIKIVDPNGKPILGATMYFSKWRGQSLLQTSLRSDAEGQIDWKHAPVGDVLASVHKEGFMSLRDLVTNDGSEERTITLTPQLVISGKVSDKTTGKPIPGFQIVRGYRFPSNPEIYWMRGETMNFTDGAFTVRFDEASNDYALKVVAANYREADSRIFLPKEGSQTFDFKLEQAEGLGGVVHNEQGEPVPGVDVVIGTAKHKPYLDKGEFNNNGNIPHSKSDSNGSFSFPVQSEPFVLMGVSDAGYAFASEADFKKSRTLVLKPWGRIRGEVMLGTKRGAGEPVTFQHKSQQAPLLSNFVMIGGNEVKADEKGRFVIDRIIPGEGWVCRVVVTEMGNGMSSHAPGWLETVNVVGGETVRMDVGGKGRPVVGQVVLNGDPGVAFSWKLNSPAKITQRRGFFGVGPRGFDQFLGSIDSEGRFRIEDIPEGSFDLTIVVDGVVEKSRPFVDQALGSGSKSIDIPKMTDGRSDEPLDVGTINIDLIKKP